MVGGGFGSALLGSLLYSGYRNRLDLAGRPGPVAAAVRQDPFAGLAVAARPRLGSLTDSIEAGLVHGMDVVLLACGGLAVLGAVLAVVFMPNRAPEADQDKVKEPQRDRPESAYGQAV